MKKYINYISALIVLCLGCTWEKVSPSITCDFSSLSIEINDITFASCNVENGSFTLVASGDSGPYTYSVANQTNISGIFEGLGAGTYHLQITDVNGCEKDTMVTIGNKEGLFISEVRHTVSGCKDDQGSLSIDVSGGTEPYLFSLDGQNQENSTFSNLTQGSYTLQVVDDSGCEISQTVEILSGISYETSIKPIIENSCAVSGCHNGSISPNLSTFSSIQTNAGRIKTRTENRSMPRGSTLSQSEIDMIACWVEDGALEN